MEDWRVPKEDFENLGETYIPWKSFKVSNKPYSKKCPYHKLICFSSSLIKLCKKKSYPREE
jgi:hypothetical protein